MRRAAQRGSRRSPSFAVEGPHIWDYFSAFSFNLGRDFVVVTGFDAPRQMIEERCLRGGARKRPETA